MPESPVPRHQRPTKLKRFLFGAAYYPEHWSAAERADDARRMAEAGVNVVRMAEFAWDRMEPRRGELDFSLFDRTIAALGAEGIDTILCTPTATPPRWLTAERPEWMRVDENGRRMDHGTRQHCCTSNEHFRAESRRITHNGLFAHVDYWRFTEELDFLGVDVYPGFAGDAPADAFWAAMTNQRCRAVSGG